MTEIIRRRTDPPIGMMTPTGDVDPGVAPLISQLQENVQRLSNNVTGLVKDEGFVRSLAVELFKDSVFIELLLEWIPKQEGAVQHEILKAVAGRWFRPWYGASLPPVPTSGIDGVHWLPPNGDNQAWMAGAGDVRWAPLQYFTNKSGVPQ